MNRMFAALTIAVLSTSAFAGPTCNAPKEKWQDQGNFKAGLEAQGFKIKNFKVTKGNCYEIYGFDKDGKKVEIYFDPESGAELERKS